MSPDELEFEATVHDRMADSDEHAGWLVMAQANRTRAEALRDRARLEREKLVMLNELQVLSGLPLTCTFPCHSRHMDGARDQQETEPILRPIGEHGRRWLATSPTGVGLPAIGVIGASREAALAAYRNSLETWERLTETKPYDSCKTR